MKEQREVQRGTPARQRYLWLLPWAAVKVAGVAVQDLAGLGLSDPTVTALCFYLGLAAGAVWQALYRRDLVDRLTPAAVLVGLGALTLFLPGTSSDVTPQAWTAIGVLVGLVLAEVLIRQKHRP